MTYNFDEIINRENTASVKYDLRKPIFGRDDILPFWVADMDFKTPDFIINALRDKLDEKILGYPIKPPEFDGSIVEWVHKRHNWNVHPKWISHCPAVVPSMAVIVMAFSNPGDEIIVQQPVYFPFFTTIVNNGRVLVNNPLELKNGKYTINLDDLREKITSKTKMIFLCNPHNPGGRVWKKEELEKLAEICLENDVLIISDEIHSDLILFDHKHIPVASINNEIADRTITLMSPSKTFNTAGLTTSFAIIPNTRLRRSFNQKLEDYHLNIGNSMGLSALVAAFQNGETWLKQLIPYLEKNVTLLEDFIKLNIPSIGVIRPEGTYLVWLDFNKTGIDHSKINKFLIEKAGLWLSDGALFGNEGRGFQRFNIACPRKKIKDGIDKLSQAFENLK